MFTLIFYLKPGQEEPAELFQAMICGSYSTLWHIWNEMKDKYVIVIRDVNGLVMKPEAGIIPRYS
jgi:hypothetical protein